MPRIHRLSDDMINKIAAGEVVERPASVVKELVENAIDAGATVVKVTVLGGGLRSIEVSDNGCGMSRTDALLAVERHATSKIRQQDDLERIDTLGFRGEALPSIASVSRFTLLTRAADDIGGSELRVGDGEQSCEDAAAPLGTTIRVEDLFYNTPARLKFMRSERSESIQISDTMQRLAITSPQVSFELLQDDRRQLFTSGSGRLADVLLTIYGKAAARQWLELRDQLGDIRIEGFIGTPELTKGTRNHQHWIVNGRYIRSRSLQHALEEAYRNVIPARRYPIAALFLRIPLHLVDVNVHPAKTEIRIQNESQLHQFVMRAVQRSLMSISADGEGLRSHTDADALAEPAVERLRGEQLNLPSGEAASQQPARPVYAWSNDFSYPAGNASSIEPSALSVREAQPGETSAYTTASPPGVAGEALTLPPLQGDSIFPPFRVVSQLAGSYILAQCARGWLIVDQHAAHERINYQRLVQGLSQGGVSSQMMLVPQSLQLTPLEEALILEHRDSLEQLGFVLEPFGERTVLLRACPLLLGDNSGEEALREILEELSHEGKKPDPLQLVEKALITLSCKSAIKANTWLPMARMEELLQQLGRTEFGGTCPHGRPTYWLLTIEELDKRFLRT